MSTTDKVIMSIIIALTFVVLWPVWLYIWLNYR